MGEDRQVPAYCISGSIKIIADLGTKINEQLIGHTLVGTSPLGHGDKSVNPPLPKLHHSSDIELPTPYQRVLGKTNRGNYKASPEHFCYYRLTIYSVI